MHLYSSSALSLVAGWYVSCLLRKRNDSPFTVNSVEVTSIVGIRRITVVVSYELVDIRFGNSFGFYETAQGAHADLLYRGLLPKTW